MEVNKEGMVVVDSCYWWGITLMQSHASEIKELNNVLNTWDSFSTSWFCMKIHSKQPVSGMVIWLKWFYKYLLLTDSGASNNFTTRGVCLCEYVCVVLEEIIKLSSIEIKGRSQMSWWLGGFYLDDIHTNGCVCVHTLPAIQTNQFEVIYFPFHFN